MFDSTIINLSTKLLRILSLKSNNRSSSKYMKQSNIFILYLQNLRLLNSLLQHFIINEKQIKKISLLGEQDLLAHVSEAFFKNFPKK